MIHKLLLLITTGLPGLHKLLFFFLIESFFGIVVLGKFSNDYYLIQLFIIFNAIGLGALLMINLPKMNIKEIEEYTSKVNATLLIGLLFSLPFLYLLYIYDIIYSLFDSYLLLIGMSGNLLVRHYYLALKEYINLFLFDVFILFFIIFVFYIDIQYSILSLISYVYLISFGIFIFLKRINFVSTFIVFKDMKISLDITLVNLLSAGVYFLLIPMVNTKLGIEYAGLIGIIFTISSILVLVPRAISIYYLPDLSKNITNNEKVKVIYSRLKKITIYSMIFLFILSMILLYFLNNYLLAELFILNNANILYILFMSSVLISQLSMAPSNILVALEKTDVLRNTGFLLVSGYIIIYILFEIVNLKSYLFIYSFIMSMIFANLYRFLMLNKVVKEFINSKSKRKVI